MKCKKLKKGYCFICYKEYQKKAWNQKYCSGTCEKKASYNFNRNKKHKLKDKCEFCNNKSNLEIHHILYVPEIVLTLCKTCHNKETFLNCNI